MNMQTLGAERSPFSRGTLANAIAHSAEPQQRDRFLAIGIERAIASPS